MSDVKNPNACEEKINLLQYFKKHQRLIPEKVIWTIFLEVCKAVKSKHEHGLAYGEIKPENVYISEKYLAQIGDLNNDKFLISIPSSTKYFAVPGNKTPCYTAPEIIKGKSYVSKKSEIWALGCLLYEMATHHSPFYEENTNNIEQCVYPPIPTVYSTYIKNCLQNCLNPDPKERHGIDLVYTFALGMSTLPSVPSNAAGVI